MTRCRWCIHFYQQQNAFSSSRQVGLARKGTITTASAAVAAKVTQSTPTIASFSTSPSKRVNSITQLSLWSSLIPKPLRSSDRSPIPSSIGSRRRQGEDQIRNKGRFSRLVRFWKNPATSFMLLGLLLGSQSVRLIVLRTEREKVREKTEARLKVLREVLEAVKAGEDVDVRARLGTGNEKDEREWEEVIQSLATDEIVLKSRRAAWRERKEAQRTGLLRKTTETDKTDKAEGESDAPQKIHDKNQSSTAKNTELDIIRKKKKAEFY